MAEGRKESPLSPSLGYNAGGGPPLLGCQSPGVRHQSNTQAVRKIPKQCYPKEFVEFTRCSLNKYTCSKQSRFLRSALKK